MTQIAPLPKRADRRLLDLGLLPFSASPAGLAERYGRGETSHTVHVWWARRPHSAMRALVFAALFKGVDEEAENLLGALSKTPSPPEDALETARALLRAQYPGGPRVLDMFSGGGTIPFEAARLGAKAHAVEANELAVFINTANMVYPQRVDPARAAPLIEEAGKRVLSELERETNDAFPLRQSPGTQSDGRVISTYLWTYKARCPACGRRFFLSKRPFLSKKPEKRSALVVTQTSRGPKMEIRAVPPDYVHPSAWLKKAGTVRCPGCGHEFGGLDIRECEDHLAAIVLTGRRRGKTFVAPPPGAVPSLEDLSEKEKRLLDELDAEKPASAPPRWSGIVNPAIYGVRTHADFLNGRQRIVLFALIKALRGEYRRLRSSHGEPTAKYVTGFLSSLIDQAVDWNCRLSMWIPQNEQVGRAFCGPGVPMLWDYAETDPVGPGPSNLRAKLTRILEGARFTGRLPGKVRVTKGDARALPYKDASFDAIVTDPPYYDNIFYSVLADFIFAWKRILLKELEPELFDRPATGAADELVSSAFRSKTPAGAHERYVEEMEKALREAARVLKPGGLFALVFSHGSIGGWEALVRAYRNAPLVVTSVQPLNLERRQRPRAMRSRSVNTCVVFVSRKSRKRKEEISLENLAAFIDESCRGEFAGRLKAAGWHERDVGIGVFAQGAGRLANASGLSENETDASALMTLAGVVKKHFPAFSMPKRRSL